MVATDRFIREIKRSHTAKSYVDVLSPTNALSRLQAIGGSVRVDRSATVRRTCSIECLDPLGVYTPDKANGLLPYGTEIYPYRGVQYDTGEIEVYPLGVFRLAKTQVKDSSKGIRLSLECYDRSRTIQRDKFVDPLVLEEGTNIIAAIKMIAERTFPNLEYDTISSPVTLPSPRLYDVEDDPWKAITELALSAGCEAYFDVYGRLAVVPTPLIDALPSPVFDYIEGKKCTMLDLTQEFSDDPGFNGVVVTGQSIGNELPAVRAVVWDEDPSSPTYHLGPYGEVPMFYTDSVATTVEQVTDVGRNLLQSLVGMSISLSTTSLVNPALEAGNIVTVVRAASHVSGLYSVEAFDIPMIGPSTQGMELRFRRGLS